MVNSTKVKTFISDYSLSVPKLTDGYRHIIKDPIRKTWGNVSLCSYEDLALSIFSINEPVFNTYSRVYKSLCPKCLNKMPEELVEELKFNYIVKKLKS